VFRQRYRFCVTLQNFKGNQDMSGFVPTGLSKWGMSCLIRTSLNFDRKQPFVNKTAMR
jgi:hypothetical protein